jgi:hypothetical protein
MLTSLADNLLSHAQAVEVETRGFLPAAGFVDLIRKEVVPNAPQGVADAEMFLPVVVSVDAADQPVHCPDQTRYMRVGCVACFTDTAVFAWMSGTFRIKRYSRSVRYDSVSSVTQTSYNQALGLDITEGGRTWTVLFAERLPTAVAGDYRNELQALLTGQRA